VSGKERQAGTTLKPHSTVTTPTPTPTPLSTYELGRKLAFPSENKYERHFGMSMRDYLAAQETLSDLDDPKWTEACATNWDKLLGRGSPRGTVEFLIWEAEGRAALKYLRADAMIAASQRTSLITGTTAPTQK
jgi:hypothetical protein